jgi:hypothetical protein
MTYDDDHSVTLAPGNWPGLAEAISSAGHVLENNNGHWYADDAPAAQAIIDAFTPQMALDFAKAQATMEVNKIAKRLFDAAVANNSRGETAGWSTLRAEMLAYKASGNEADCPWIAMEAADRGISVAALAAKVEGNAARFEVLRAAIAGKSGRHRDNIAALTDVESVLTYDYTTDWPEV